MSEGLKAWAYANNLGELYEQYKEELRQIALDCIAEGYPSNGANYELMEENLKRYYPELFPEEGD